MRALKPLRDVTISIDGHHLVAQTPAAGDAAEILAKLRSGAGHYYES